MLEMLEFMTVTEFVILWGTLGAVVAFVLGDM